MFIGHCGRFLVGSASAVVSKNTCSMFLTWLQLCLTAAVISRKSTETYWSTPPNLGFAEKSNVFNICLQFSCNSRQNWWMRKKTASQKRLLFVVSWRVEAGQNDAITRTRWWRSQAKDFLKLKFSNRFASFSNLHFNSSADHQFYSLTTASHYRFLKTDCFRLKLNWTDRLNVGNDNEDSSRATEAKHVRWWWWIIR